MKKLIILILAFFFLKALLIASTNQEIHNQDLVKKNQLQESIDSVLPILEELDKYSEDSPSYKKTYNVLLGRRARVNFVVEYYNNLQLIRNNPALQKYPKEKELREKLLFMEANRIYREKYSRRGWLEQTKRKEIDEEFLKHYLTTDRFLNLVLRVYEKQEDFEKTKRFLDEALLHPEPMNFILRDLTENIEITIIRKYRMEKGDTLEKIFGKRWKEIAKYNKIKPGQERKIPIGTIIIDPQQAVSLPKDVDQTIQIAWSAAEQLEKTEWARFMVTKYTVAIARIESREGRNVGIGNYLTDMNPEEWPNFLKICRRLGRIPEETPVSQKPDYGSGGAMGPAQFLSSTWLVYEPNVVALTLKNFASPYNLKDGIFGIASKIVSGGIASGNGELAERRAVMLYLAGTRWDKDKYQWYWEHVYTEAKKVAEELKKIREEMQKEQKEEEKEIN